MDEKFGSANWFFTLSYAEYDDSTLHSYLIEMNSDLPDIKNIPFNKLIHMDPVSVCNFIEKKFRTFFNKVIKQPNGPLGEV